MTIVYILVALLVGWVIGFLDSNMRTSKKIEAAEARAEQAVGEAEKKFAGAQAQIKVERAAIDDAGLLRLRVVDGARKLEVDGVRLEAGAITPDQRKRLIELLTSIRPWVEGGGPPPPEPRPPVPPRAQPSPAEYQVDSDSRPRSTEPLAAANPVEQRVLKSLSIVAQIDTILQARLAGTPLIEKGIRLTESVLGGVEVFVGIEKFPSIDDVPDPQIKSAIRAAVAEWEKKFTPGE